MPMWYYDKNDLKNSPSFQDSVDAATERRYREEGARFIINTGTIMNLGYNTMATGVVYFHRFYMFHSFRTFNRYVTACCCLLLAGKVEETPKKCKDIIETAKGLLSEEKFASFGNDAKEEVITLERILLQTIKFDLEVKHPYNCLLQYAKCLQGDKKTLEKTLQTAWTFVNDSFCTTLPLQWEPEVIAVAVMYLAGKLRKFEVIDWNGRTPRHVRWWDMFVEGITIDLLEDICHQVLDLYYDTDCPLSNLSSALAPRKRSPVPTAPPPLQPPPQPPQLPNPIPIPVPIPTVKNNNGEHIHVIQSIASTSNSIPVHQEMQYPYPPAAYAGVQYPNAYIQPMPPQLHTQPMITNQPPNYGYMMAPLPNYMTVPPGYFSTPPPPVRSYYPPPNP